MSPAWWLPRMWARSSTRTSCWRRYRAGSSSGSRAVLHGKITFAGGRVEQGNFNDYRILRIDEMPSIEVHIVPSTENSGGIGEPGTVVVQPAVANAVFAATGVQLTRMPIDAGADCEGGLTHAHQADRAHACRDRGCRGAAAAGVVGWMVFQPGPYAFATGTPVELAAYQGPSPAGAPAELANADAAAKRSLHRPHGGLRGLPHRQGRRALRRRARLRAAVRHDLHAEPDARSRNRHRQMDRRRLPQRGASRHRAGRLTLLSRLSLPLLHAADRRRMCWRSKRISSR